LTLAQITYVSRSTFLVCYEIGLLKGNEVTGTQRLLYLKLDSFCEVEEVLRKG
jgi:hypothetical protein